MLSFLHRASLMQRHNVGGLDRPLLLALIGITSMLTDLGPGTREYGEKCIDESEGLILKGLENASTIKVQTLALIIKYRILTRRFSSAFMLAATAARFATALRLNYDNPDLCFLAQESRRRLMWALFMIDQGMAGGYRDLTLWTPETIHISLPCNERDFEFDLAPPSLRPLVPSPDESENDDIGSLALHVRILWLRGRILKFAKRASNCSNDDLGRLQEQLQSFAKELSDFAERLPVSFRWSDNSLRLRAYSPRLCVFIMIHVWLRQCNCDLFRIGLVGLRDSLTRSAAERLGPEFIAGCQRQCYEHAMEMSNMFTSIRALDHYPVADLDMPVCAYQCIRMLYYIYHLNAEEYGLTPEILRKKASVCLEVTKGCCSGTAAVSIVSSTRAFVSPRSLLITDNSKPIFNDSWTTVSRYRLPLVGCLVKSPRTREMATVPSAFALLARSRCSWRMTQIEAHRRPTSSPIDHLALVLGKIYKFPNPTSQTSRRLCHHNPLRSAHWRSIMHSREHLTVLISTWSPWGWIPWHGSQMSGHKAISKASSSAGEVHGDVHRNPWALEQTLKRYLMHTIGHCIDSSSFINYIGQTSFDQNPENQTLTHLIPPACGPFPHRPRRSGC